MNWSAYFRLMRGNKPIGILLLWFPTAWALWIANHGAPDFSILVYFLLGTFIMRSAGCIINDIADRDFDKHVKRTQARPLTTGELTLTDALLLLMLLLFAAFLIVLQLPIACFYYALIALLITAIYPFCKRFFQAPQLILGLAFSMGIPMAYAASGVSPNSTMYLLFLLNFAWIISYDTMYAMVDREDDLRIGIQSTAILFGKYDRAILLMLQVFFHSIWLYIAYKMQSPMHFYVGWFAALMVLLYQQRLIYRRNEVACFRAFTINWLYGLLMWIAVQMIS